MINTLDEQQKARNRLLDNFSKIALYLSEPERKQFYKYLLLTFDFGIKNGIECAYFWGDNGFIRFVSGDTGNTHISDDICEAFNEKENIPLSITHNHPKSIAPSYNDINVFLKYPFKNIVVCGHIGNLYFLQKDQYIIKISDDENEKLLNSLRELYKNIINKCLQVNNYTAEDLKNANDEIQAAYFRIIDELYFDNICKRADKGRFIFKHYKEGAK
ncbi:MAG: hypothetical protein FWC09_04380 [Lachnospiraceae bacterium]|nr:hypothetical protein [Lachnospiraceae bacterium]